MNQGIHFGGNETLNESQDFLKDSQRWSLHKKSPSKLAGCFNLLAIYM